MLRNLLALCSILSFCLYGFADSREICYGELGCFIDTYPFSGTLVRPIATLPDSPEKIGVQFSLFTWNNLNNGFMINHLNVPYLFNSTLKTVFICHGFLDSTTKPWMYDIKNALLRVENMNVIIVDWTKGNGLPYTKATANTQVVGAEIARLINSLIATKNVKAADFHLIGHSLGSHISGYAGARVKGLGRITALDPAGPYFENADPIVRLDPTDALYVDAIHTDGDANLKLGLGLMQPVGHADFYPNGGKLQPGCKETSGKLLGAVFGLITFNLEGTEETTGCNHMAAIYYFIESIATPKCTYTSYPCASLDDYNKGKCISCSSKGCNQLGYWSSPNKDQGSLYLGTLEPLSPTHCSHAYKMKLVSSNLYSSARGKFRAYLSSASKSSPILMLDDEATTFKPSSSEVRMLSISEVNDLSGRVESIFVSYTRTGNIFISWLHDSEWSFKSIELVSAADQQTFVYCPTSTSISTSFVEFKRC